MDALSEPAGSVSTDVEQNAHGDYEHHIDESDGEDAGRIFQTQDARTLAADRVNGAAGPVTRDQDKHPEISTVSSTNGNHADDRHSVRNLSVRHGYPNHTPLSWEGYFGSYQQRSSPSSKRAMPPLPASTQSSSGSLHALSEHEEMDSAQHTVRRATSTKSNPTRSRIRSTSLSKVSSLSHPGSKRPSYSDKAPSYNESPVYPDQSLASLQAPVTTSRPHPILRTRSSHPAQNHLYNDMARNNRNPPYGIRTADNTPMSSPGLFNPVSGRPLTLGDDRSTSPQLHHLQTPKETHTAAIEHDVYSGNKFINNYEIIRELGRGEHGKVKLGRDIKEDTWVAIKIVPRFSAKRRFRDLRAPEDRTKREIAILKKARHPHVVSLLEVIDDPNKNKVYLILEYVEKGEIKWRKHGVKEVLAIKNQRFDQEKLGVNLSTEPTDRDLHVVRQARLRHDRLEQMQRYHQGLSTVPNWSLEYAGETDEESELQEISRSLSRQFTHQSGPSRGNSQDDYLNAMSEPPLSGSLYGSFTSDAYRHRKFSIAASAASHMSSEMNFEQDDDQRSYVPALTMEEARRSFRDTLLGLEFLHFIGIIHRDIKPANLIVSSSGAVKISDFGVSYLGRPITEEEVESRQSEKDAIPLDDDKELARSVGTPAFWAPELCYEDVTMFTDSKEPRITGALDLWALGITLYCMIYARLPFYHDEQMGLHEAVCTTDVFCPRTRLMPVDTTSAEPVSRSAQPINSDKRLDYELKFEDVPESLRDLIQKLLIKDPAKRITIAQAKSHPWVTEDMVNPEVFFENKEAASESKKRILEINEGEIARAVVKRTILERALTTAGRIAGNLLGRKDARKRASTTASSAGSSSESLYSPTGSTASTIGKSENTRETRRTSLRGDELLQALKAHREPSEHPLAQSQTASPDSKEPSSPGYFERNPKAASTGATPGDEVERPSRPRAPDRAVSALSTADSIKTVRASQRPLGASHMSNIDTTHYEPSLRSRVEGLWEGTTKTLNRLASRDRGFRSSRSRSRSRPPSESDGHAGPSLALSNTYAAGAFQTSNTLKSPISKPENTSSVSLPSPNELPFHSPFRAPSREQDPFEKAQQLNSRRQIQEAQTREEANSVMSEPQPNFDACPPSPDDLHFQEQSAPSSVQPSPSGMQGFSISTAVSASTIASSVDAYDNSSVSQSVSNPSLGIVSGSSSPPGDNLVSGRSKDFQHEFTASSESEPEFMRTADTVTLHGRPTVPTAPGKSIQEQQDFYEGDDDESDSSDEEGIMMGGPKKC